jgi:hypothetical protein
MTRGQTLVVISAIATMSLVSLTYVGLSKVEQGSSFTSNKQVN